MKQSFGFSKRAVAAATIVFALVLMGLTASAFAAIATSRVSVPTGGGQAGAGGQAPAISGDGRYVAFVSSSTTLVAGGTNGHADVFVHDRLLNTTERVSVSTGGAQGNGDSSAPAISSDGRFVAGVSLANNLVIGSVSPFKNIFVRDRLLKTTVEVSVPTVAGSSYDSDAPSISANGRYVAFHSGSSNLVPNDTNGADDVFVRDLVLKTTERDSVSSTGAQAGVGSWQPSISADGRYVTFLYEGDDLVPNDSNGLEDVLVHDRLLGTTEMVTVSTAGVQGHNNSYAGPISANGRFVAFSSRSVGLVPNDTNQSWDVFVRDRLLGTTERDSVSSTGTQALGNSYASSISADGRYVVFRSDAPNLVAGDTNNKQDVFVRDRLAGTTERVNLRGGLIRAPGDRQGNGDSFFGAVSADGRWIAYESGASNLVAGDTNGVDDVFLADRGQLSVSLTRSPAKSAVTYTRREGVVRFTPSVTVSDERGVKLAGAVVLLQTSTNGKLWRRGYTLTTNASGVASKVFKATARSTTYYRWVMPATDADLGHTTAGQRVVVK